MSIHKSKSTQINHITLGWVFLVFEWWILIFEILSLIGWCHILLKLLLYIFVYMKLQKNKKLVNNKKIVFFLEFPLVLFIGMICTTCFLILFFFYKNYWYMMFVIWLAWFCKRFILFGNSWYHGWKYNFIFGSI